MRARSHAEDERQPRKRGTSDKEKTNKVLKAELERRGRRRQVVIAKEEAVDVKKAHAAEGRKAEKSTCP